MYKQNTFIFLTVDQFFKMYKTINLQSCAHLILVLIECIEASTKIYMFKIMIYFCKHQRNFKGTLFSINETYTQQIYLNYYIEYTCLISNNRVSHIKEPVDSISINTLFGKIIKTKKTFTCLERLKSKTDHCDNRFNTLRQPSCVPPDHGHNIDKHFDSILIGNISWD